MSDLPSLPGPARLVVIVLAVALCAMLGAALVQRVLHPDMTVQLRPGEQRFPVSAADAPAEDNPDDVGVLMKAVAENPSDRESLLKLTEIFMTARNWDAAESFAKRAAVLDAQDARPPFLLGVILHNLGRHEEAAQSLGKAVALRDTAPARYSLGILCIYYLDRRDEGLDHLRKALTDASIDPDLKKSIEEELNKPANPAD
ncbi:MAG: CDC27 family protein [Desulfovibrio sp.]|jgi:Flp pilus assembly protein TadD|nr:CDC27 family protein [Desulfovibrio sp.]